MRTLTLAIPCLVLLSAASAIAAPPAPQVTTGTHVSATARITRFERVSPRGADVTVKTTDTLRVEAYHLVDGTVAAFADGNARMVVHRPADKPDGMRVWRGGDRLPIPAPHTGAGMDVVLQSMNPFASAELSAGMAADAGDRTDDPREVVTLPDGAKQVRADIRGTIGGLPGAISQRTVTTSRGGIPESHEVFLVPQGHDPIRFLSTKYGDPDPATAIPRSVEMTQYHIESGWKDGIPSSRVSLAVDAIRSLDPATTCGAVLDEATKDLSLVTEP